MRSDAAKTGFLVVARQLVVLLHSSSTVSVLVVGSSTASTMQYCIVRRLYYYHALQCIVGKTKKLSSARSAVLFLKTMERAARLYCDYAPIYRMMCTPDTMMTHYAWS